MAVLDIFQNLRDITRLYSDLRFYCIPVSKPVSHQIWFNRKFSLRVGRASGHMDPKAKTVPILGHLIQLPCRHDRRSSLSIGVLSGPLVILAGFYDRSVLECDAKSLLGMIDLALCNYMAYLAGVGEDSVSHLHLSHRRIA